MDLIVISAEEALAKNGSKYAKIKVLTSQKESKTLFIWSPSVTIKAGNKYSVDDEQIANKNGSLSVSYGYLRPVTEDVAKLLEAIVPKPVSQTEWDEVIKQLVFRFKTGTLKEAFLTAASDLYLKYAKYPAAISVHQTYKGGLLNHTFLALKYLNGMMTAASQNVRCEIAATALLFHDYGKLHEYKEIPEGFETTPEYPLLGHIYISAQKVKDFLRGFNVSESDNVFIQHCILAHHGQLDWGSPVLPANFEAYLVHTADMLSARDEQYELAAEDTRDRYLGTTIVHTDKTVQLYESI